MPTTYHRASPRLAAPRRSQEMQQLLPETPATLFAAARLPVLNTLVAAYEAWLDTPGGERFCTDVVRLRRIPKPAAAEIASSDDYAALW